MSSGARTLNRDFKDVRRHSHVAAGPGFNGWVGLGVGLGLGLAVAFGVHLHYRGQVLVHDEPVPAPAQAPASSAAPDDAIMPATADSEPTGPDYNFYDILPKQEVDVSNAPKPVGKSATSPPLPTGGAVLQAGAFKQTAEAEKMVAQLALSGITAKIQRASVDDETWYRVRIGPIATVEELSDVRSRLREAEISASPVTTGDEVPLP